MAAPTAGLHFENARSPRSASAAPRVLRITLHVGFGTFQPVRVHEVEAHRMHSERYAISQIVWNTLAEKRVLAVGTTTLRALEAAAAGGALAGETDLHLSGFEFKMVKRLPTNFHLPKSTLLMLVSAFAGVDNIRRAYAHAIAERYRFFSYGDATLIEA